MDDRIGMAASSIPFWLVFCVIFHLNIVCGVVSGAVCKDSEKLALLKFKQSLIDPSGRLSSWSGNDCCRWHGVNCNNRTGHVVELQLRNPSEPGEDDKFLGGEISSALLALNNLEFLDLSQNDFDGEKIPEFIGSITSLRYLNLSDAGFVGIIPHQLGNLTNLQYLDLHWIHISSRGLVVDNLEWLTHLQSLQYLDLSSINLTEASIFDSISKLPSLSVLRLEGCSLSEIPATFSHVNLTSLKTIDLRFNYINSTLPDSLFGLPSLINLDLAGNALHGSLPTTCKLQKLDLSQNDLSGDLTSLIQGLLECPSQSLQDMNLGNNLLTGNLPEELGRFENLVSLNLGNNLLSGSIPLSIGRLYSLRYLRLYSNSLTGPIPESIGRLTELVVLDMSYNHFSGVVSEVHLGNLSRLEALFLSSNSLDLRLSSNWIPQFQLKNIHLDSCNLGPLFPAWLRTQRNFSTLDISINKISDTIPDWFWNLSSRIFYLNISHNQIGGSMPASLIFYNTSIIDLSYNRFSGQLPRVGEDVEYLYLSHNSFSGDLFPVFNKATLSMNAILLSDNRISGSIPTSLCNMSSLEVLDMSNNLLTGEIPNCLEPYSLVSAINLANNSFSGKIPPWICSTYPESLHLNNNHFYGEITSLQNCTTLSTLDLGHNNFSGIIPTWLADVWHLALLSLRSNRFHGSIPQELSRLSYLQILDLADNNLSGYLPKSLGNLSAMNNMGRRTGGSISVAGTSQSVDYYGSGMNAKYEESLWVATKGLELQYTTTLSLVASLDLSENNLQGDIPEELMHLSALQTLNLSGNHLIGNIPKGIGGLTQLESLDFSRNQLSGMIPTTLSSLNYVSYLNLSYNNLSGRIPIGSQLQLLGSSSYAGNVYLCGYPLEKKCPGEENSRAPEIPADNAIETNESETIWVYVGMMMGFAVGFWGLWGLLLVNNSWRTSYFQFIDRMTDNLHSKFLKKVE